jgi:hypothetical protein
MSKVLLRRLLERSTEKNKRIALGAVIALLMATVVVIPAIAGQGTQSTAFAHPGVMVSKPQLDFVREKVQAGSEPWKSAYAQMTGSQYASLSRSPRPRATVECGSYSKPNNGCTDEREDAIAAYTDALAWYIGGDEKYAQKAVEIMDAWSSTIKSHTNSNAPLQTGWAGSVWPRAADIIRSTYSGWSQADRFATMLRDVYLPEVINGSDSNGNWELSMMEAAVGISVFLDDRTSYDKAVDRYLKRVAAYIYVGSDGALPKTASGAQGSESAVVGYWQGQSTFTSGLTQETCRDLTHTGYGISAISHVAETAWIQGQDLYSQIGDRLGQALEFQSKYELGADVPSSLCGGSLQQDLGPVTEVGFNALHTRLGESLPETQKLTDRNRPAGSNNLFVAWETLTHGDNPAGPPTGQQSPAPSSSVSASPAPTGPGLTGGRGSTGFPARFAAPYVETWKSPSALQAARAAGLRYATLAFVLDGGGCKATYNGNTPITDEGWLSTVTGIRGSGGEVIASFGGAWGTELAQACDSVDALKEQYRTVVDTLDLSRIDLDIEGASLADTASVHRRNEALAALQKEYEGKGRRLDVQYTLPSGQDGLDAGGVRLLQDAQSAGLRVALVNILTLDYGSPVQDMGQAAIDAATALHGQLGQIYTGKSDAELWAMEGNTPMIGVNDSQGEVFSIDDAKRLADFAVQKGIQELSYWAVGRDKACSGTGTLSDDCSGTEQSDHQFLTTFNAVTTTAPGTAPAPAASGSPAPQASGTPEARHPATLQLTADAPGGSGSGKTIQNAFTTGYTWFDNTPRGSAQIFAPVLHQQAGGTGTWKDPITLAVGHTINGGKDTLDYPAGTRFYIPTIRRYFIVEDACGDGGSPQNGACHKLDTAPQGATTWLDLYIGGGSGDNESAVQDCAGRMTGLKTVIQDPADGLPVVEGPLFSNGKCTTTYGDN